MPVMLKHMLLLLSLIFQTQEYGNSITYQKNIESGQASNKVISVNQVVKFGNKSKSPCLYAACIPMGICSPVAIWGVIKIV